MPITAFSRTQGIKYIKIAKFDSNEINNTISLSQLTQLLLVSPDLNIRLSYDVVSRTEYSNYFLYGVLTNPNTASNKDYSDYNILFNPNIGNTPFINSDYDILAGNIDFDRYNQKYMDVDYADSQIVPVNLQTILLGTATLAKVQDSNYTLYRQIGSRYLGHQLNSPSLNQYKQSVNDQKLGILYDANSRVNHPAISYGQTPNVSNPKAYFIQFNYVAGTSPELGDSVSKYINTSIKYIIDENGKRINPINDIDGINLGIIKQSFNTNATVQLSNPQAFGNDMSTLNGTFPVFRAGEKIKPIIYTQVNTYDSRGNVGPTSSYSSSVTFTQGDIPNASTVEAANDYRLTTFVPNYIDYTSTFFPNAFLRVTKLKKTGSYPFEIKFNSPIFLGTSGSFPTSSITPSTGSRYKPTGSLGTLEDQGYILYLESYLIIKSAFTYINAQGQETSQPPRHRLNGYYMFTFALQKSTNDGNNWDSLVTSEPCYIPIDNRTSYGDPLPFIKELYLRHIDYVATTSSLYRVAVVSRLYSVDGSFHNGDAYVADGSYFKVTQFPSPSTGQVTRFWFTDNVTSNLLYAAKGGPPSTSSFTLSITPIHDTASSVGSASINVNGVNIMLTGSNKLPNSANLIYVSTGSSPTGSAANIAANINASSSAFNNIFSEFLSDISASNTGANLNLNSKSTGVDTNQYYVKYTGLNISSGNPSVITGYFQEGEDLSTGLNDVWGQKQIDIEKSGFDPINTDFEPQEGDEIRFNGTEKQTYIITGITQSLKAHKGLIGTHPTYTLILDKNISTSSINTNYFLLRRYFEDPSNIILEINKPAGSTSTGIIKPEYVTKTVEEISKEILSELITTQS
jgi:hypothetical protein